MVYVSICGLSSLQVLLCVLRVHHLKKGNLFLNVFSNTFQVVTALLALSYSDTLKMIGSELGINGLAYHGARRNGAGLYYFVLRIYLFFLYRSFS